MGLVFVSIQPKAVSFVGAFSPLTFKVIIDILVPVAIFLIVWVDFVDCFFVCLCLSYVLRCSCVGCLLLLLLSHFSRV